MTQDSKKLFYCQHIHAQPFKFGLDEANCGRSSHIHSREAENESIRYGPLTHIGLIKSSSVFICDEKVLGLLTEGEQFMW